MVLDVGNAYEQGSMFDCPSMLLTEDYPHSLYQYTLDSLGRRKKDYVLSQPRCEDDAFKFKISRQSGPNDSFILCNNRYDFYVANTDLMNIDAVAQFDWPHVTE